jgi:pyruvate dehydrogenase E1 component alpha subunit
LKEPLARFKLFLEQKHQWTAAQEEALIKECNEVIQKEVEIYLQRPCQPITAIFDYHFAQLPDYLIEQRAIALENAEHA